MRHSCHSGTVRITSSSTGACARDTTAELRHLAIGKPLLLQLLDAFECGETLKEDVMRVTGMSATDYHNARRQLARLVHQRPGVRFARLDLAGLNTDDLRQLVAAILAPPHDEGTPS